MKFCCSLILAGWVFVCLAPAPRAAFESVAFEKIIDVGLESPIMATHAGDGSDRLFIIEQAGRIRIYNPSAPGEKLLSTSFLDITGDVDFGGERGLLGLAFHPDYASNGRFFVHYSDEDDNGNTVIAEYLASPPSSNVAQTAETVILTQTQPQDNHNGGSIEFGPDGYLYIALGDGGNFNDTGPGHPPEGNGQNLQTFLGKLLRINVNAQENGNNYAIPLDNPFRADPNALDEIYAYGLRNPYRFNFDAGGSRALYLADVGQGDIEEIDIIERGGNYGWKIMEGPNCFIPSNCNMAGLELPIIHYTHIDDANGTPRQNVTGGFVYRGSVIPELVGYYLFADYNSGEIWALGSQIPQNIDDILLSNRPHQIAGFGQDEDLELYVLDYNGGDVYKLVNTANRARNFEYYE